MDLFSIRTLLSRIISTTPIAYLPVRVKGGAAKGARWTLLPFSNHWRVGGEPAIQAAIAMAGDLTGASCWDFGAHFGIFTIGFAMRAGETGEVAAFEPDPKAFKRLSLHVKMNRLANIKLFPLAVSNSARTADLLFSYNQHVFGAGRGCSHFQYPDEIVTSKSVRAQVKTIVPDLLVEAGKIRDPKVIKVDIQGHAAEAFDGSRRTIARSRPLIILSSHSERELVGSQQILEPLGYKPFDVCGQRIQWQDFVCGDAVLKSGG